MSERESLMGEPTHEQLSGAIYAKLLKVEEAILRVQALQLRMEARLIAIKEDIQEQPKVGSFASTDK
ncbi:MAG TPA: hypothetical protein VKC60_03500 [Opitutaceae bacterium]|nr:hypothetical protein [Opitutaceae bacterium]